MTSVWNQAYSAPKGYDLRAPYNVPMGQIQELRVVAPFSISSTQKDTVVGDLPRRCCPTPCRRSSGLPSCLHAGQTYHHIAGFQPCTAQPNFYTVQNRYPPYADLVMEKVYLKNSRIK